MIGKRIGFPQNDYIFGTILCNFRAIFFGELLCMKGFVKFFHNLCKIRNIFLQIFAYEMKRVLRIFFVQNRKYYAKFNFLNKLTNIEVLSAELNN